MNDLTELVELLSRQRLLLERLLFRVVVLRGLVVGGHARFVGWASDDVETAAKAVAQAELRRGGLYAALAAANPGLPGEFAFDALIAASSEPATTMLMTLRSDMGALVAELRHNLAVVGDAATDGHTSATEVLARLRGMDPTAALAGTATGHAHVDARL